MECGTSQEHCVALAAILRVVRDTRHQRSDINDASHLRIEGMVKLFESESTDGRFIVSLSARKAAGVRTQRLIRSAASVGYKL